MDVEREHKVGVIPQLVDVQNIVSEDDIVGEVNHLFGITLG